MRCSWFGASSYSWAHGARSGRENAAWLSIQVETETLRIYGVAARFQTDARYRFFSKLLVTTAAGINNLGQVVRYFTDAGAYRAFIYDNGVFTKLDLPPGADNESFATGINDAGQIVGYFNSATGNHGLFATPTRQP
jgi:probable HAF family extracellular repeat protein